MSIITPSLYSTSDLWIVSALLLLCLFLSLQNLKGFFSKTIHTLNSAYTDHTHWRVKTNTLKVNGTAILISTPLTILVVILPHKPTEQEHGQTSECESVFVEYVIIISSQNESLYYAADEGNVKRVRQCISDGADVNFNKVSFQLF